MNAPKPQRKQRRPKGSGSVYRQGRIWWIAYRGPDGRRIAESTSSVRKGDADRLLQRRVGARDHGLPVIPGVERLTFEDPAKAVIEDFTNNGKKSLKVVKRRIDKHLMPFFRNRRLVGITAADVRSYVTQRKDATIIIRKARTVTLDDGTERTTPEERKPVSNAEINRELQVLKRIFSLAMKDGKLAQRPHIAMLREDNVRTGFFEPHQYAAVRHHLPDEIAAVVTFAYVTGWRIASEVLPLQWRQVDLAAGEVRLDAGTTKNGEGRVFPLTVDLRALLQAQWQAHDEQRKAGHLCPFVFFRLVAKGRRGPLQPRGIVSITKAWKAACRAAGCPGRIPHDLRRTAVRNMVRAGVPERVAMQLTGHKTRSVFERYNIVSDGDLREAVRRLDGTSLAFAASHHN